MFAWVADAAFPLNVVALTVATVREPAPLTPLPIDRLVDDASHASWLARVFVTDTTADVPTVLLNRRYFVPAEMELAVVIVLAVEAVPVRSAVTVEQVRLPPVFVSASVLALYVKALAWVSREDVSDPDAAFVNRSRKTDALAVLVIVTLLPLPVAP
jgi:hypothetical protein